jgi:hypothetical protein
MKCEKYVADLAEQVKMPNIKGLTMSIVVRHLADQVGQMWRSSYGQDGRAASDESARPRWCERSYFLTHRRASNPERFVMSRRKSGVTCYYDDVPSAGSRNDESGIPAASARPLTALRSDERFPCSRGGLPGRA